LKTEPKPTSAKRLADSEVMCDLLSALLYERARADAAEAHVEELEAQLRITDEFAKHQCLRVDEAQSRLSALTEAAQAVDDAWMQDTSKLALPAAIQGLRRVRRAALEVKP
jgi:hypothetical protein